MTYPLSVRSCSVTAGRPVIAPAIRGAVTRGGSRSHLQAHNQADDHAAPPERYLAGWDTNPSSGPSWRLRIHQPPPPTRRNNVDGDLTGIAAQLLLARLPARARADRWSSARRTAQARHRPTSPPTTGRSRAASRPSAARLTAQRGRPSPPSRTERAPPPAAAGPRSDAARERTTASELCCCRFGPLDPANHGLEPDWRPTLSGMGPRWTEHCPARLS